MRESRFQDGFDLISAMISQQSAVEYYNFMPLFLSLVETMSDKRAALNLLGEMQQAGFFPGDLETHAYNDLLASTASYESSIDFALEIIQEMESRNLRPDMQATRTAFGGYFSGVS